VPQNITRLRQREQARVLKSTPPLEHTPIKCQPLDCLRSVYDLECSAAREEKVVFFRCLELLNIKTTDVMRGKCRAPRVQVRQR